MAVTLPAPAPHLVLPARGSNGASTWSVVGPLSIVLALLTVVGGAGTVLRRRRLTA